MKFETLLKKARALGADADISEIDFLAAQINVEGDGNEGGVFYVEVKDGQLHIEPYEYYDRQCMITISNADFAKFLNGKLDAGKAYDQGILKIEGDLGKALVFADLMKKDK